MATPDDPMTPDTDESEVAFIVSCGDVTTRMVAEKDDMGVVRQVFREENALGLRRRFRFAGVRRRKTAPSARATPAV